MIGHLNGCMLLGFRKENKNETLEVLHCPEPGGRNMKEIEYNYYSSHFPKRICSRKGNFLEGPMVISSKFVEQIHIAYYSPVKFSSN